MTALRASFDPEFSSSPMVRVQPWTATQYTWEPEPHPPVALGSVDTDGFTIASTDTAALRRLAAALLEAADLADAVTAEHATQVPA